MADTMSGSDASSVSESTPDWRTQFGSAQILCAVVLVLLLISALFFERFRDLVDVWLVDANYSHGFLVFPISIALAIYHLRASKLPLRPEAFLGLGTVCVGCVLAIGTTIVRFPLADFLALRVLLRGIAVAIAGRQWASVLTFPIFFLFFMFPLPVLWTDFAAIRLQDWVGELSGRVLEIFFVCHQRGNMIIVAGASQPLYVAQECSGLRQLVSFVALAVLIAHLVRRGPLFGLCLLLAAIPIAILSNVLRILLMAVLLRYFGAEAISGHLHNLPALVTLPIGLACFFMIAKAIGEFFAERPWPGEESA